MQNFVTQLIREKMTSVETPAEGVIDLKPPVSILRSNRLLLKLNQGVAMENVVIRAQTTHVTLRLASRMMIDFQENGLFLSRDTFVNWEELWESVLSPYERKHNPNLWCALYLNGISLFKTLHEQSGYMDLIEKRALATDEKRFYDATTEDTDKGRGHHGNGPDLTLRVDHSTQIAMHMETSKEKLVCRIFFRESGKYHAFSFALLGTPSTQSIVDGLRVAAAYMETSNLKLMVEDMERTGAATAKREKIDDARQQMKLLAEEIQMFEKAYASEYQEITF